MADGWSLGLMAALGAYHGLNPAMGWLFAVSLGLQERSRGAVLRALGPIAVGHEAAIAVAAAVVFAAGAVVDSAALRMVAAAGLVAFGVFRFVKPRAHFPWRRGQVEGRELAWWSFLMASAHGAGLMVVPVLIGGGQSAQASGGGHNDLAFSGVGVPEAALGLLLHVGAMLAVMAVVAVVVYDRLGVAVLRRAWVNTEWLWAGAFIFAGVLTLFS